MVLRNSGTAKRSASRSLGEESHPSVWQGNVLCARTLVILWVLAALQVWFVLEQPQGSQMENHPCFQHMASILYIFRHRICMYDYGALSSKPTWLYCSDLFIVSIVKYAQQLFMVLQGKAIVCLKIESLKEGGKVVVNTDSLMNGCWSNKGLCMHFLNYSIEIFCPVCHQPLALLR